MAKSRVWKSMSSAPVDRLVLFKVPFGSFAEPLVGKFDPMRGWVNTVQNLNTEGRIFPTAWCEIPPFDDDDLNRTEADRVAMVRPLKKHEHAA